MVFLTLNPYHISMEKENLMEESIILDSIVRPISINRIYADREIKDSVLQRIEEIFKGNI